MTQSFHCYRRLYQTTLAQSNTKTAKTGLKIMLFLKQPIIGLAKRDIKSKINKAEKKEILVTEGGLHE
jgi:hypothetical protein